MPHRFGSTPQDTWVPDAQEHAATEARLAAVEGKVETLPPLPDTSAFVQTTDPRLTDARSPTPHVHPWAEVSGKPSTYPPTPHRHPYADLDQVPATFPAAAHNHVWTTEITGKPATFPPTLPITQADVTGLATALAAKAPSAHQHPASEVTGLPVFRSFLGPWVLASASIGTTATAGNLGASAGNPVPVPMPFAGLLVGVWVRVSADIGGVGVSLTAEVWKNGAATGVRCTITGSAGSDLKATATGSVAFVAGDEIDIRFTKVGTLGTLVAYAGAVIQV